MRITNLRQDFKQKSYLYYCNNRDDDAPTGGIVRLNEHYYFINNSSFSRITSYYPTLDFVPTNVFKNVNTIAYNPPTSNVKAILSSLGKHLFTKDVKGFNYVVKRSKESTKSDFSSSKYRRNYIYEGIHSYHYSHETIFNEPLIQEKDYKIGVELEVECKDESCYNEVKKIKSNWFQMEKDSSLNSYGIEFVTIPLNPKDAKRITFWKRLITYLSDKANSWDSSRCGLHCHIGREILGRTRDEQELTLTKLLYLYHHLISESLHYAIFGRSRGYNSDSGKTDYGNACVLLGNSILKNKNIEVRLDYEMKQKNSRNRYFDINISNSATIEFRKGKGSLNPKRICMIVDYCELMCLYCRKTKITKLSERGFLDFINRYTGKNSPLREKIQNCF